MTIHAIPDQWAREIASWRTAMRAMRLTAQTIELRSCHIRRLARAGLAENPWAVERSELLEWVGEHNWGRETARTVRSSLRRFWTWGLTTGRTDANIADVIPRVRPEQPRPRPADSDVVASALRAADPRVALMLRLATELGMRRGEVAQVHPERDLARDGLGRSLIVHGKGERERVLPLPDDLADQLFATSTGYLFPSPTGGHLSAHWVGTLVSRALADGTTMHQLRHLCATEIHSRTHDVRLVQELLGHASLATTQRYLAVDDAQVRAAVNAHSRRWQDV